MSDYNSEPDFGSGKSWLPPIQELIDSGKAWQLEGHVGRQCMAAIEEGHAILGPVGHRDYWGNYVPSRDEVEPGTKGSVAYAKARGWEPPAEMVARYQKRIDDGIEAIGVITRKLMEESQS